MGRAGRAYREEWRRIAGYYGQEGKPLPSFQVEKMPYAAETSAIEPPGQRPITFGVSTWRGLKQGRHYAANTVAHELTHEFQTPETLAGPHFEQGAYQLAKAITRQNAEKRDRAYRNLSRFVKKGQFGL